jgi:hypothetical protein
VEIEGYCRYKMRRRNKEKGEVLKKKSRRRDTTPAPQEAHGALHASLCRKTARDKVIIASCNL